MTTHQGLTFGGYWFCSEPGQEEIRFHTASGMVVGVTLTCKHGKWAGPNDSTLSEARRYHGYTFDPPPPVRELP